MNDSVSKYLTQQVMTASPAKLVSMLYDRAIMSLKEAVAAIEAGQIEARWKANNRAMEIIGHMWSTLDCENGAEIAENLDQLFSYMLRRLPEVDLHDDAEAAREVIALLEPLAQSWREVAAGGGPAPGAGAPPQGPSGLATSISA